MTSEIEFTHRDRGIAAEDLDLQPMENVVTLRVWELPVRILHWTVFTAVAVLTFTGFYIGNPFIVGGDEDAFLMGTIRAIHLAAAWAFSVSVICRVIWAFIGNHWAKWHQFLPVHKHRRVWWRRTLAYYLFLRKEPPPAAGHNPLAGTTYTLLFLMFLLQILTGLALAALANPQGILWATTGWVFDLAAIQTVRLVHHIVMWMTIGFVIHHVYSVVLVDIEEKTGLTSSIVTGYKRLPRERI